MAPRKRRVKRLPKAPLTEVVFELRWKLLGDERAPALQYSDPGLLPLVEDFSGRIRKSGYRDFTDFGSPVQVAAYSIARRYFKKAGQPFPIMQVGPGIFATNESSQYDWETFKGQVLMIHPL